MCSLELETAVRASGWGVKGRFEVDAGQNGLNILSSCDGQS
jgi:hypothetical protein